MGKDGDSEESPLNVKGEIDKWEKASSSRKKQGTRKNRADPESKSSNVAAKSAAAVTESTADLAEASCSTVAPSIDGETPFRHHLRLPLLCFVIGLLFGCELYRLLSPGCDAEASSQHASESEVQKLRVEEMTKAVSMCEEKAAERYAHYEQEVATAHTLENATKKENKRLKSKLADCKKCDTKALDAQIAKLQSQINESHGESEQLKTTITELTSNASMHTAQQAELEAEIVILRGNVTDSAKNRSVQKAELEVEMNVLRSNVTVTNKEKVRLEATVSKMRSNLTDMKKKKAGLEAEIKTLRSNASDIKREKAGLEAEIETLRSKASEISKSKAGLEAEVKTLRLNASDMKKEKSRLEAHVTKLEERLLQTNAANNSSSSKLAKFESEATASAKRIEKVAQQLADCELEVKRVTTTTARSCEDAKSRLEKKYENLLAAGPNCSDEVKAADVKRAVLAEQLTACKSGAEHMKATLRVYDAQYESKAVKLQASGKVATPWKIENDTLIAQLSVLPMLSNSTIAIPEGASHIFVEVGCNSHDTMDESFMQQFRDAFLISFEPLLHHYSSLLARTTEPRNLKPLGKHHERGIILPFAMATSDGMVELLTAGSEDDCASLLRPSRVRGANPMCATKSKSTDVRQVPAFTLNTLLRLLSWKHEGGWPIDYLKLDARGLEVEILRAASRGLSRIHRVEIKMPGDACSKMYEGSLSCSEIVASMEQLGYKAAYNRSCENFKGNCYEEAWEFLRFGVKPLHHRKLAWADQCWHGEMAVLKDSCCRDLGQGLSKGCFNYEYTQHRCCAHRWLPQAADEPDFE